MHHPSIETLLGRSPENLRHIAGCADCRRMTSLVLAGAPPSTEVREVPVVERSVFTGWEELPDARGGMGKLWRAFDQRLGRHVALKQVRDAGDPGMRALLLVRLEHEARMTARLQHPAIVAVYEVGRFPDGELFYCMPLVAGRPLAKELDARPTLSLRLGLLPQLTAVAEAIAYSHGKGVIHRDLKPHNILIGAFGEAVVIDWGLAKECDPSGRAASDSGLAAGALALLPPPSGPSDGLTQMGLGTPQYMAPEQARGETSSPLADVYGLGSTLYHLLAGEPPYGYGDARSVRHALQRGPPRSVAERVPEAPAELVHICERAMSREPALRFGSAGELAEELRRFQTGRLLQSRRYSTPELLLHFVKRHRASLSMAAAALAALIGVSVAGVVNIRRQRDRAEESQQKAEWALRRAQGVLASKLSTEASRRLEALALGVRAVGPELSGRVPVAPSPEAAQGLFDALAAGPAPLALNHGGAITDFAVSPDGSKLLGVGDDRTALLWDARSGKRLASFSSRLVTPHQVRFSPRGDRLSICGGDPRAELFEVASARRIDIATRLRAECAFAPDGTFLTLAETLALRDPVSGATLREVALPTEMKTFAVAPDGRVALAGKDGSLRVWSPRGGAMQSLAGPGSPVSSLAFDGAGEQLVMVRRDEGVHAFRRRGEEMIAAMQFTDEQGKGYSSRARFSADGRLLYVPLWSEEEILTQVFATASGARVSAAPVFAQEWASEELYLADAHGALALIDAEDGRAALSLAGHADEVKAAAWLGDAAASASREGGEFLWDLRPGIGSGLLLGHTSEVSAAAVDPAWARLATASFDGTVRVWPLPAGAPAQVFRGAGALTFVSWSPDGEWLLTAGLEGNVRLLEPRAGTERELLRTTGPVSCAQFSSDGRSALVASLDGTLALLDLAGAAPRRFAGPEGSPVTAAALSPSGREVASAHADGSLRVWAVASLRPLAMRPGPPQTREDDVVGLFSLVYVGEDRLLLGDPGGTSSLVNAHTLLPLRALPGRAASASAQPLSPDGRWFAAVTPDGGVLLHDLQGSTSTALSGHRGVALATAFSRDGALLATGGLDGALRLYDVATGRELMQQNPVLGPVTAVAFTADARWVLAGHRSGALRMQPATPAAALERACSVLRRFEQAAELAVYCPEPRTEKSRNAMNER